MIITKYATELTNDDWKLIKSINPDIYDSLQSRINEDTFNENVVSIDA